ncbi:MAG: SapB/AmfS family lanthipeptide [Solirubrobacteraceae bacterium]
MAILDLQDMEAPKTISRGSTKKCDGKGGGHGGGLFGTSGLSLLLCC